MFHAEVAQALLGKSVVIGITERCRPGADPRRVEFHGRIVSADPASGITVELAGKCAGRTYVLPADTDMFRKARPGRYHLPSTGEDVQNPDYLSFWSVNRSSERV